MKRLLMIVMMTLFTTLGFGQKFNLPPGEVLKDDVKIIDYSYKLEDMAKYENFAFKTDYLYEFSSEELVDMKANKPDLYNYYMKAEKYFTSLSQRVKKIFPIDELWHIYKFDPSLTEKLMTY